MISTPAARICGPPIPKIATSRRCLRAVARRAAYMSPEAPPAERRSGMVGMSGLGRDQSLAGNTEGSAEQQAIQRFANEQLGLGVDAGGSFVQNQEARIVCQSAGEIDELALADGKS